ncbi:PucR family transcriptional regulator [Pseudolysinimonas sp.]|jgi:hypothetical protein|uniref:PucR family transcriptional regulator n=1 Tax=Pseudolysinimonas sp. TaxID=2680009 RepID=UPI00378495AB
MTVKRPEASAAAPFAWLIDAAVSSYGDTTVAHLLDPDEEARARRVLPASFFGWMATEADATVAVVSQLNEGDSRVSYAEVARAASRILTEFAFRLIHDDPERRLLELTNRFAGEAARLGIDAAVVVQSMRVMERRWVDHLLSSAGERAAAVAPQVLAASAAVYDSVVDGFVAEYVVEHSRIAGEAVANKRALVEALLRPGVRGSVGFEELGIDLDAHHLALVLWFPAAGVASQLEALARQIGVRTLANSVLTVPGGDHDLWVWLTFATEPSDVVFERIRGVPRDPAKVGLAVGPVAAGVTGFRRSHLLASEYGSAAKRLPVGAAPEIADSGTVAFLSLLLRDRERAEWFVATELGEIGVGVSPSDVESRDTLRIYLETGQSLAETAARLRIHRNTVVYRLRRIEQAIGRPVASRRHELYAAALIAHLLAQPGT